MNIQLSVKFGSFWDLLFFEKNNSNQSKNKISNEIIYNNFHKNLQEDPLLHLLLNYRNSWIINKILFIEIYSIIISLQWNNYKLQNNIFILFIKIIFIFNNKIFTYFGLLLFLQYIEIYLRLFTYYS